jgi:hypothetical protein
MPANSDLVAALYALKEESAHAYKQVLEGEIPSPYALGRAWNNVETLIIQLDMLRRFQMKRRSL